MNGTLYAVLCYSETEDAIQVVTIYQSPDDDPTISNICTVKTGKCDIMEPFLKYKIQLEIIKRQ